MRVAASYNTLLLIMSPADTSDLLLQRLIKPVQAFSNQVASANRGLVQIVCLTNLTSRFSTLNIVHLPN